MGAGRARRTPRGEHAAVLALGLAPAGWLAAGLVRDALGADPVETILHTTGAWALRLLLLALAVSPLRRRLGWRRLAPHRRTLGLLAFGYASLHLTTYVVLDLGLAFGELWEDVVERPFITVGFAAFVGMLPLAATSTRGAVRRLGRRWTQLHRLAYAIAVAGVVHFWWGQKADVAEPAVYALVLAALLAERGLPVGAAPRRP